MDLSSWAGLVFYFVFLVLISYWAARKAVSLIKILQGDQAEISTSRDASRTAGSQGSTSYAGLPGDGFAPRR
jgi:hypothetical protein